MKGTDLDVGHWYVTTRPHRWDKLYRPAGMCRVNERLVKLVAKNVMPKGYHKVEVAETKEGYTREEYVHSASFKRPCESPYPIKGTQAYLDWQREQVDKALQDVLRVEQEQQAKEVVEIYDTLFPNNNERFNRPIGIFASRLHIVFGTDIAEYLIEALKVALINYQPKEEGSNGYFITST